MGEGKQRGSLHLCPSLNKCGCAHSELLIACAHSQCEKQSRKLLGAMTTSGLLVFLKHHI